MARPKSKLTEKQDAYVEAVLDGNSRAKAAKVAGYASPPAVIERSEDVAHALHFARSELSSATQVKRADMIEVMLDAIGMARTMADPVAMIAGAREVSKVLGFYEPEKKVIELTGNQLRVQQQFAQLSDQELLDIIEGESSRVEH
jgi:phage terminase small subunit